MTLVARVTISRLGRRRWRLRWPIVARSSTELVTLVTADQFLLYEADHPVYVDGKVWVGFKLEQFVREVPQATTNGERL